MRVKKLDNGFSRDYTIQQGEAQVYAVRRGGVLTTEIVIKLPEPVYERLKQQAREAHLSLSGLLARRINRELGSAVGTAQQARQRALRFLRPHARLLLRTGEPTFNSETEQWHVPVRPNVRQREVKPVGEVCLAAPTGQILTLPTAIAEMLKLAAPYLGTKPLPSEEGNYSAGST
ncbi:MAG TPA: hypothetical protein EYP85_11285 [Armatimonadetes bacterium]|nr:hypothetical protein [Armatimonadota bacterium]